MYKDTRKLLSEAKFYEGYSRWDDKTGRYETWDEAVDRVMNMHRQYYASKQSDALMNALEMATRTYKNKLVLGAQRALQFGGEQLLKHHMKIFNCTSSYADRPSFFGEFFYILLCGAGAGFSVQRHHIDRLPNIGPRNKQPKTHVVEDSIEGWATSLDVLMSSYFVADSKYPEYQGRKVYFDLSQIRPKGAMISGGFKAPGPDALRRSLDRIEYLLQGLVLKEQSNRLRPIHVYDICMHTADAVLAGGVRRSATICLFSPDDLEMANAKTGNWFKDNPQRARSNNSAVINRSKITREQFSTLMTSIKQFGEPGFFFVDDEDVTTNPCVTGDAVIKVKDHDVMENGEVVALGVEYTMNMKDLVEMYKVGTAPKVLSKNLKTGELEYKNVLWADLTRRQTEVVEITCEKTGKTVKVTPDHKIWTENRGWVEAKDLTEEDQLDII